MHIIAPIAMSLLAIVLTYFGGRYLQPFSIGELGGFGPLVESLMLTIRSQDAEKLPLILGALLIVISIILSGYLINHIRAYYSDNLFLNILNSIWLVFLVANALVAGYYLLFLVLGLIVLGVFLLAARWFITEGLSGSPKSSSGGTSKPVYVRSHYRSRPIRR
ncbi:MAG: hypothetical protein QM401_11725 [Bacillota bacterium]|nr:hypothetical protein [Bacillota bacterium]NMA61057.1 hypothetical protein [Bacillota bacterium]